MVKHDAKILVVDDDADILTTARVVLRQQFQTVETESNPQKLNFLLNNNTYDVILLDMNYSAGKTTGNEGIHWLQKILEINPQQQVIAVTAYGDINLAVDAMKNGAADFIVKPWDNAKLEATVFASYQHATAKWELHQLKTRQTQISRVLSATENGMIGSSTAIKAILKTVSKVADTEANILILGENGTGKELVAKEIHRQSPRRDQPFIKVDIGSIAPTLFESELFGHKKGSFTDAREDKIGRIELANGGTLFLDEVGNLSSSLQSKLLSVLQNREVIAVGSHKPVPIDVRLISATNADIHGLADMGEFRKDLLYRVNTVEITVPPLRSRVEDIAILADHFLKLYAKKYRKQRSIDDGAIRYLENYKWPGNVRELQHAIERAVIMSESTVLTKSDFILSIRREMTEKQEAMTLDEMERNAIIRAIQKYNGNMSKVAKELGVGRTTLYRKMEKYGLSNT